MKTLNLQTIGDRRPKGSYKRAIKERTLRLVMVCSVDSGSDEKDKKSVFAFHKIPNNLDCSRIV